MCIRDRYIYIREPEIFCLVIRTSKDPKTSRKFTLTLICRPSVGANTHFSRWKVGKTKKTNAVNNGEVTRAVRCFQSNLEIRAEKQHAKKFCVARLGLECLVKHNIRTTTHAAYSPDLSLCDFWSVPEVKRGLRGRKFETDADVIQAVTTLLNQIPKEEFGKTMLQKWDERMKLSLIHISEPTRPY